MALFKLGVRLANAAGSQLIPSLRTVTLKNNVWTSATLDKLLTKKYNDLDQKGKVLVTYLWIDGTGEALRTKTRTMDTEPERPEDCSVWGFDGSSTGQAQGSDSDLYLHPCAIYADPFTGARNKLVMCYVYDKDKKPAATNHRHSCEDAMNKVKNLEPWFGLEQEFTLLDEYNHPYGWPKQGFPTPQGPYYCAVGAPFVYGREIQDATYKACLAAGINITGTNCEVMPAQFEFQIGPSIGVDAADELWVARYILQRMAEEYGVYATLDPKPIKGDWNGAGCHCNFSTKVMRQDGGMEHILNAIKKLEKRSDTHQRLYDPRGGLDNRRRLTGQHETARWDQFTWGVAHRGASVRIPRRVDDQGKGFLEDRRPSSNADPYQVTDVLVRTICLDEQD